MTYTFKNLFLKPLSIAKEYTYTPGDKFVMIKHDCGHVGWQPAGVVSGPSSCAECSIKTVKAEISSYRDFAVYDSINGHC